jgi:transcription-repair coupling factor (superfamily II helicase)
MQNILEQILENKVLSNIESYKHTEILYICGVVDHLIDPIITYISNSLGLSIMYAKRNNSDIQKYLLDCEYIESEKKSYTLPALEYSLNENNFIKTDKIQSLGEWSLKGDTIQFWPIGYTNPVRVSYFDDEIESIELVDEVYNTRIKTLKRVYFANLRKLPEIADQEEIKIYETSHKYYKPIIIFSQFDPELGNLVTQHFGRIDLDFTYPQVYFKRFDILEKDIELKQGKGWKSYISTRFKDQIPHTLTNYLLKEKDLNTEIKAGIESVSNKLLYLTDRELFGTIVLDSSSKKARTKQAKKILARLEGEIDIDNFVVHEDHGIGIYKGIKQEKLYEEEIVNFETIKREKTENYMFIQYAQGDALLVPLSQLHKITKYIGSDDQDPEITRLHQGLWKTTIQKTRRAVALIAKDLVTHFAKLSVTEITPLEYEDTLEYAKFIQNFPYIETPDQETTEDDIKKDLAQIKPMNRLIVGDVGFGKTEIAMRASFKIIENLQQVTVLCPTTVLAAQHYKVFKDRFKSFGTNIQYLSRFNKPSQNKKIIQLCALGKVDIVIGTHRLLSNDVEFKNLGLIIIDEEQKFGVKQKEKIRKLQYCAHSLSMSATPIPRTLSMALSEIKDISIIATPPKDRFSVMTTVNKFDWNNISTQIKTEIKRGGQVYFVHNRVETIESIKTRLQTFIPNLRIAVAHGQMQPSTLEKIISDFYERKYDVLLCTTIIENGIDMPNVNTIIINDGQNFGLGQLYQLRGRVGRGKKQAYCYIYYKGSDLDDSQEPNTKEKDLTDTQEQNSKKKAKKYIERLKAIMENQELGSGFKLASRDLEIRGAGSFLGERQHGHISKIGLALYMQMLAEEIERMKQISQDN